jgi:hypothetical protein
MAALKIEGRNDDFDTSNSCRQLRLPRDQIGDACRCRRARLVRAVTSGDGGGFCHEVRHCDDQRDAASVH